MVKCAIFPDLLEKSPPSNSSYLGGSHTGHNSWVDEGRNKKPYLFFFFFLLFFPGEHGVEIGMGWPLYGRADRGYAMNALNCLRTQKSA